jgi:hypothetical protein
MSHSATEDTAPDKRLSTLHDKKGKGFENDDMAPRD